MGLMARLLGGGEKSASIAQSESAISPGLVFAPGGGFSPNNPGKMQNLRSIPVLTEPRYFTAEEADKLEEFSRQKKSQLAHTEKAIGSLKRLEKADAKVQSLYYREYAPAVASSELGKVSAKTHYAQHLHGLRAPYAQLGAGLDRGANKASAAVAAIRNGLR